MNDYKAEILNKELEKFDELNALRCEFEQLRKDYETIKEENELLQTNLQHADAEINYLKGQIEAYQYVLNCHR